MDSDLDNDHGRNGRNGQRMTCQINNNDQNRKRQVTEECCNRLPDEVARLVGDQCQIQDRNLTEEFEDCARQQGINDREIQCRNDRRNNDEF